METKIAFPQMLNKYRLQKNLTMEQLAEEVGKTKIYYFKMGGWYSLT